MTQTTPKSMRLHVALFGRTNSGKSTLLNAIAGQDVSLTSPLAGTTTDAIEKPIELPPLGPILLIDTAGMDDPTELGALRMERAKRMLARADAALLVTTAGVWGEPEESILCELEQRKTAAIPVISQCDIKTPSPDFLAMLQRRTGRVPLTLSPLTMNRDALLAPLKKALIECCPEDFVAPGPMLSGLVSPGDAIILIVPIDKQAPKGRLILPQAQCIREALDLGVMPLVVQDSKYQQALKILTMPPKLVICDSQVVSFMVRETPQEIPCTTFSILLARLKGDFSLLASGAAAIGKLDSRSRVLIAEACTHQACDEDIGRVKIPKLIEKKCGAKPQFQVFSGHDYPEDLSSYNLVVHCGSCMLNRRETLHRMMLAKEAGCAITNYGMAISYCTGVLERVLSPFPETLNTYRRSL